MKIHEYQAKAILARHGVPVPRSEIAFTATEAPGVYQVARPGRSGLAFAVNMLAPEETAAAPRPHPEWEQPAPAPGSGSGAPQDAWPLPAALAGLLLAAEWALYCGRRGRA